MDYSPRRLVTGFLCIALAALRLILKTRDPPASTSSAGIKGVYHHYLAKISKYQ